MKSIQVVSASTLDESDKLLIKEAEDVVTSSLNTATDFCKTLIGLDSGAIPVYFAIMKYLGVDQIPVNSFESYISMLPPVFFLLSIILSSIALIPRRFSVHPIAILTDYKRIRNSRASVLKWGIISGSIFYILGLIGAIFVFIQLLV